MYHMHTLGASRCMLVVHSVGFAMGVGDGGFTSTQNQARKRTGFENDKTFNASFVIQEVSVKWTHSSAPTFF